MNLSFSEGGVARRPDSSGLGLTKLASPRLTGAAHGASRACLDLRIRHEPSQRGIGGARKPVTFLSFS